MVYAVRSMSVCRFSSVSSFKGFRSLASFTITICLRFFIFFYVIVASSHRSETLTSFTIISSVPEGWFQHPIHTPPLLTRPFSTQRLIIIGRLITTWPFDNAHFEINHTSSMVVLFIYNMIVKVKVCMSSIWARIFNVSYLLLLLR